MFLKGFTFSISHLGVPPILLAPAHIAARQWAALYSRGVLTGPPIALISAASFVYLAYTAPVATAARLYAGAAACLFGFPVFTMAFIVPTNNALFARRDAANKLSKGEELTEVGMPKGESTAELINKWQTLNHLRGCLALGATLLGVRATLT